MNSIDKLNEFCSAEDNLNELSDLSIRVLVKFKINVKHSEKFACTRLLFFNLFFQGEHVFR